MLVEIFRLPLFRLFKYRVHYDNQLTEFDLMICTYMTSIQLYHKHAHTRTELFKIFFSLLILFTAFLQKASGPEKIKNNVSSYLQNY